MPRKVLIVDEDELARKAIGAHLVNNGYVVSYAGSCDEAKQAMDEGDYDVVVADIDWPGQQGVNRISQLRKLLPQTPLVAVSTFANLELEQEARQSGAFVCLRKPVDEENLLQVVESALNSGPLNQEGSLLPGKLIEQILLRGFTAEQQWEFQMTGVLRPLAAGEALSLNDDGNYMAWVEQGRLDVFYGDALLDTLGPGDFWGEEAFVYPNAVFTRLVALEDCQLRQFSRKRIIDFFAYHDETLTKRYMINLIHCLHIKWKRTAARLATGVARQDLMG